MSAKGARQALVVPFVGSFDDLDEAGGLDSTPAEAGHAAWYQTIRTTPLGDLPIGDLARALRLRIHVAALVARAVPLLAADPLAGAIAPGEVVASLASLTSNYFSELPTGQVLRLGRIVDRLRRAPAPPDWHPADAAFLNHAVDTLGVMIGLLPSWRVIAASGPDEFQTAHLDHRAALTIGRARDADLAFPTVGKALARRHVTLKASDDGVVRVFHDGHDVWLGSEALRPGESLPPDQRLEVGPLVVRIEVAPHVRPASFWRTGPPSAEHPRPAPRPAFPMPPPRNPSRFYATAHQQPALARIPTPPPRPNPLEDPVAADVAQAVGWWERVRDWDFAAEAHDPAGLAALALHTDVADYMASLGTADADARRDAVLVAHAELVAARDGWPPRPGTALDMLWQLAAAIAVGVV
jgi:hypothetical protein